MHTLLLFGAGASFGSGECEPTCPPLGKDLFLELEKWGGIARSVRPPLRDLFIRNFETGMVAFSEAREGDVPELLRDLTRYFVRFSVESGNLYHTVITEILDRPNRVTIATTNYDVLIDQAISLRGRFISYSAHPPKNHLALLKIHGSCHFLPDVGSNRFSGNLSGSATHLSAGIRPARSEEEVIRFLDRNPALAPAIALYAPGKKVLYCPDPVREQQAGFEASVAKADVILMVGLSVLPEDDHIWGILAKASAHLKFVGGEGADFARWSEANGRQGDQVLAERFRDAVPMIVSQLRQ